MSYIWAYSTAGVYFRPHISYFPHFHLLNIHVTYVKCPSVLFHQLFFSKHTSASNNCLHTYCDVNVPDLKIVYHKIFVASWKIASSGTIGPNTGVLGSNGSWGHIVFGRHGHSCAVQESGAGHMARSFDVSTA